MENDFIFVLSLENHNSFVVNEFVLMSEILLISYQIDINARF